MARKSPNLLTKGFSKCCFTLGSTSERFFNYIKSITIFLTSPIPQTFFEITAKHYIFWPFLREDRGSSHFSGEGGGTPTFDPSRKMASAYRLPGPMVMFSPFQLF